MNYSRVGTRIDSYFDTAEPSVVHEIRWRICHQILAAKLGFNLAKVVEQVVRAARKIRSAAGFVAEPPKHVLADAFKPKPVADADRINDHTRAPRAIDRFV